MTLFATLLDEEKRLLRLTFGDTYTLLDEPGFAAFWQDYAALDAKGRWHLRESAKSLRALEEMEK